jgi:hypothetical protein
MTQPCQRAKSLTTSTNYSLKLLHHLNQMLRLQKLLSLLIENHVNQTYSYYKHKNRLNQLKD